MNGYIKSLLCARSAVDISNCDAIKHLDELIASAYKSQGFIKTSVSNLVIYETGDMVIYTPLRGESLTCSVVYAEMNAVSDASGTYTKREITISPIDVLTNSVSQDISFCLANSDIDRYVSAVKLKEGERQSAESGILLENGCLPPKNHDVSPCSHSCSSGHRNQADSNDCIPDLNFSIIDDIFGQDMSPKIVIGIPAVESARRACSCKSFMNLVNKIGGSIAFTNWDKLDQ